jgi:hypothetical protein
MENRDKLYLAIQTLKSGTEFYFQHGEVTEENFNKIEWVTGETNGSANTTTTNPHSELTWTAVKAEMDKL